MLLVVDVDMTTAGFISKHEGRERKPYKCPAGKNTIGVGWNMDAHPLPRDIQKHLDEYGFILDEHIDRLLLMSISWAVNDCKILFPDFENFSHNRKMALTDFLFNVGLSTAKKFKRAITCINAGGWDDAAKHMLNSKWAEQCKNRAKEVTDLIKEG